MDMRRYSEDEIKQWKIMRGVGFSYRGISSILKNASQSTIEYYLNPEVREHRREYWRKRRHSVLGAWRDYQGWLSIQGIKERAGLLKDFRDTLPLLETRDVKGKTLYRPKGWVLKSLNST